MKPLVLDLSWCHSVWIHTDEDGELVMDHVITREVGDRKEIEQRGPFETQWDAEQEAIRLNMGRQP